MSNLKKISFCTVTYNNEDKISHLLKNLEEVTSKIDAIIYVVDNGSQDNTKKLVKSAMNQFSNIKLIVPEKNAGFGAGNNAVMQYLNSEYHVLVNPDVTINSDSEITKMITYMDKHPNVGLLSPKILNSDGTIQKLFKHNPSVLDMALRFISPKIMKKRQAWFVHDETGYNKVGRIGHASGAFMFFRTSIFKEVHGFDERYFMYMEDADITKKINQVSIAIFYPNAVVDHEWQRNSHKKIRYTLMTIFSMFKYFDKWGWKLW